MPIKALPKASNSKYYPVNIELLSPSKKHIGLNDIEKLTLNRVITKNGHRFHTSVFASIKGFLIDHSGNNELPRNRIRKGQGQVSYQTERTDNAKSYIAA